MVSKEGAVLLPISLSSVKNEKDRRDGRFSIFWLQITTVAFFLCWLSFLTGRSFRPETSAALGADLVQQLIANQEVRSIPVLWEIEETTF